MSVDPTRVNGLRECEKPMAKRHRGHGHRMARAPGRNAFDQRAFFPIDTRQAGAIRDLIRRPNWVGGKSKGDNIGQSQNNGGKKGTPSKLAG